MFIYIQAYIYTLLSLLTSLVLAAGLLPGHQQVQPGSPAGRPWLEPHRPGEQPAAQVAARLSYGEGAPDMYFYIYIYA